MPISSYSQFLGDPTPSPTGRSGRFSPFSFVPTLFGHSTVCSSLANFVENKPNSKMASMSRARVYADVNSHRPREYWDYESHVVEWG